MKVACRHSRCPLDPTTGAARDPRHRSPPSHRRRAGSTSSAGPTAWGRRRSVRTALAVVVFVAAAARPRTGRSDPVRPAARLQHRFRRRGSQPVGHPHPAQSRAGRRHGGGLRLVLAVASRSDRVDARGDRRGADRPAARARGVRRRRGAWSHRRGHEAQPHPGPLGAGGLRLPLCDTGRVSLRWRRCVSSCLWRWRRRGHGAPAGGRSSSGCSATRFAGTCGRTWCRSSTSGCAACCSADSWPPAARTTHGSGSP